MSLFPAYSATSDKSNLSEKQDENAWLSNPSFVPLELPASSKCPASPVPSTSRDDPENVDKQKHKKQKKLKQKKTKEAGSIVQLEFSGHEKFYVDKTSQLGYLKVEKLYNPACPRYHISRSVLGRHPKMEKITYKRYFVRKYKKSDISPKQGKCQLTEEEFTEQSKQFNGQLRQEPNNIALWIEFIELQCLGPLKSSTTNTQIAERKMSILDKALVLNPANEELYSVYVDTIDTVFPSFEVSKILERLLAKDPVSYTLWKAQILATQGSMARCIVPDVLNLYDKCMSTMYRKQRNDITMLKLFTSCAFFLRQSGLLEQFFALIKLALELNVSPDKFTGIDPLESDQNTLVEFEEVVLGSGLPMNEIWLRIEKLRTSFNFLPCPLGMRCTDPQRSIFNEDVCHFIYPLTNHCNSLELIFIILRLLKIPLPHYKAFGECHLADLDAAEEFLNVLLYLDLDKDNRIPESFVSFVRELAIGPSFMSTWIGSDIYTTVIADILLRLSDCHSGRQRSIFILLWLHLHRLLITIERLEGKLDDKKSKNYRRTIKAVLRKEENRNEMNYFTEYALIEYELGGMTTAEAVFKGAIENSEIAQNSDKYYASAQLCELWLKERHFEKAFGVISNLIIGTNVPENAQKLIVLKKLQDQVSSLVNLERNIDFMQKEQFILPDYLMNLLKINVYAIFLTKSKMAAVEFCQRLRKIFSETNCRHNFIRETLWELEANVETLGGGCKFENISEAVKHFPNNIFLLKSLIAINSAPWYKLKGTLVKCNTPQAILMLIVAARTRHGGVHQQIEEDAALQRSQQLRVLTALRTVTSGESVLRKNALMWRLHLRSAYELESSLHQCKHVLFAALDECPWNKSLYLDGAVYVPQELTQLQDLIIEKQLRIYALPEELEILRCDNGNAIVDNSVPCSVQTE
ncbi:uncharacterized protein DMENIID0001_127670 [Sergentomyia squamirostris]